MLREPRRIEQPVELRKDKQTGRFLVVRLEERIAPHQADYFHKHGRGQTRKYNGI